MAGLVASVGRSPRRGLVLVCVIVAIGIASQGTGAGQVVPGGGSEATGTTTATAPPPTVKVVVIDPSDPSTMPTPLPPVVTNPLPDEIGDIPPTTGPQAGEESLPETIKTTVPPPTATPTAAPVPVLDSGSAPVSGPVPTPTPMPDRVSEPESVEVAPLAPAPAPPLAGNAIPLVLIGPTAPAAPETVVDAPVQPLLSPPPLALPPVSPALPLSLLLNPSVALGSTNITARGSGCPGVAPVRVSVDGTELAQVMADSGGNYEAPIDLSRYGVGRRLVTAACGAATTGASVDVVLGVAAPSTGSASVGVVLAFFVLLLLLITHPFGSSKKSARQPASAEGTSPS